MNDLKRILVVSRLTRHCREVLHQGVTLARLVGAELYLLHVIHDPFGFEGWNLPITSLKEEYEKTKEDAKKKMDLIVELEKGAGLIIKEMLKEGKPVDEIIHVIETEKIDLLIMLSHQEGRLEHFIFGRTNEELTRRMPCSILLVNQ
jgi:nucleotide-binding universal stress UspA family protein